MRQFRLSLETLPAWSASQSPTENRNILWVTIKFLIGDFHGFFTPSVLLCKWREEQTCTQLAREPGKKRRGRNRLAIRQMESGDLDLGLLRTFLAVVDCGSLGKTAAAIDKTQSAVSQQMLRLEKIVGQKLFVRGRDGITLTHHGEMLMAYASRAVDLNEEMLAQLRQERAGGQIALGISNGVALVGLTPAMKRFQAFHPDLELRAVIAPPNELEALLTAGRLHLAIGEPALMRRTPAARWQLNLDWASYKDLNIDGEKTVPLVLFEGPCSWQDNMLESLRKAGREWRVAFQSASLDAVLTAAQSGLGITPLPTELIRKSKLVQVKNLPLPRALRIEFGLFQANTPPQGAKTLVEMVRTSKFKPSAEEASE